MGKATKRSAAKRSAEEGADRQSVTRSLRDYVRAIGGGLLIGMPLLFTMEMWFHGFLLPGWKILLLLVVATGIVVGYSVVSGFRREPTFRDVLVDVVETMGISIVVAAVALLLLGRIGPGSGIGDAAGKIALEAVAVAFGVSLAGTQMSGVSRAEDDSQETGAPEVMPPGERPFARLFVAAGGALLFALNVAPTDEIPLLAVALSWWQLLLLMAATYLVTLAIVFYADFLGGRSQEVIDSPLDQPLSETTAAYAISLVVAALMLWAFGRTDEIGLAAIAGMTVVLAVVASFGAAVGRLLVGGGTGGGGGGASGSGSGS